MRTIELTGRVVGCGMRLVHQNLCDAVGRGVALNGVINSASTGGDLGAGGYHRVVFCARWIFEACRSFGE